MNSQILRVKRTAIVNQVLFIFEKAEKKKIRGERERKIGTLVGKFRSNRLKAKS